VALLWAAFGRPLSGIFRLSLNEMGAAPIRTVELNLDGVTDNSWCPFLFEPIAASKDRRYSFCVEVLKAPEGGITIWTDNRVRGDCRIDDEGHEAVMCFKSCYRD
jgi:hypothetical protein